MSYKQLVSPNLGATDGVGWCLRHVQKVFGVSPQYATARLAWNGQRGKHTSSPPSGVAVPVWYSWHLGGVDYGHVAAKLADGRVLSSPFYDWQGGQVVYTNMGAMMDALKTQGGNPKYLGWSEWLHNRKLVEYVKDPTGSVWAHPKIENSEEVDEMQLWIADVQGAWYLIVPTGSGKPNATTLLGDSGMGGGGAARAGIPVVRFSNINSLKKVANV